MASTGAAPRRGGDPGNRAGAAKWFPWVIGPRGEPALMRTRGLRTGIPDRSAAVAPAAWARRCGRPGAVKIEREDPTPHRRSERLAVVCGEPRAHGQAARRAVAAGPAGGLARSPAKVVPEQG